jgi:hypothetical protein
VRLLDFGGAEAWAIAEGVEFRLNPWRPRCLDGSLATNHERTVTAGVCDNRLRPDWAPRVRGPAPRMSLAACKVATTRGEEQRAGATSRPQSPVSLPPPRHGERHRECL